MEAPLWGQLRTSRGHYLPGPSLPDSIHHRTCKGIAKKPHSLPLEERGFVGCGVTRGTCKFHSHGLGELSYLTKCGTRREPWPGQPEGTRYGPGGPCDAEISCAPPADPLTAARKGRVGVGRLRAQTQQRSSSSCSLAHHPLSPICPTPPSPPLQSPLEAPLLILRTVSG